jgi:hypothetical protein
MRASKQYLDNGFRFDEVRAATNRDGGAVAELVHRLPEQLEVLEAAGTVRVDHEQAPAAAVKHPVAHRTALAAVALERDDPDTRALVLACELECSLRRAVA